jgi:hypothetical protein
MLSKLEILLLTSIFSFALLSVLSFAAVICTPCEVNNCICTVEECSSGILRIYSSSNCRIPSYEYTFYSYRFNWTIASTGTHYFKAFCSDGKTTACTPITVKAIGATTTTTTIKEKCTFECCEGETKYLDKSCSADEECVNRKCKSTEGYDYTWLIVAVVAVAIVAFVLFFFVFKRKPKRSFQEIYRKWSR